MPCLESWAYPPVNGILPCLSVATGWHCVVLRAYLRKPYVGYRYLYPRFYPPIILCWRRWDYPGRSILILPVHTVDSSATPYAYLVAIPEVVHWASVPSNRIVESNDHIQQSHSTAIWSTLVGSEIAVKMAVVIHNYRHVGAKGVWISKRHPVSILRVGVECVPNTAVVTEEIVAVTSLLIPNRKLIVAIAVQATQIVGVVSPSEYVQCHFLCSRQTCKPC